MKGYSYIISDGKRVDFRLRKSFSDFFWDTLIMVIFLALIGFVIYLFFMLEPLIPIVFFGSLGIIGLVAYIRWIIWDRKWSTEHEVSKN